MELVIDKELLGEYLKLMSPQNKDEKNEKLILAIESTKNKIKLSSNYIQVLEEYFKNKSSQDYYLLQTFITNLVDSSRIVSFKSDSGKISEFEELETIFNYNYNDLTFLLRKKSPSSDQGSKIKSKTSVFEKISKPNIDWLILSLSTCYVIQLDYSDFNKGSDLENIFKFCSSLPEKDKVLHIIDSYFSLYSSSQLRFFIGCGLKIKCYSSSVNKKSEELDIKRTRIKNFFGKNVSIKFSSNKSLIHERKLMLCNLIIESTHDFSEIDIKNKNWTLYLVICDNRKKTVEQKISSYN